MVPRSEYLVLGAALAAGGAALAQSSRPIAELEAEARRDTPYKAGKIMALDQAGLIRILGDKSASEFEKAKACQRLAIVGDARAAPALAALLSDAKLSHYARMALERIPGPEADAALRAALTTLKGSLLVGAINSIGRRKDPKALDSLATLRNNTDSAIAAAAEAALAAIRRP